MVDISNINFFLTMTTTSEEDANTAAEAHRLGLHALNAGNFKVSLSFFRKALKVNPKIIEYWASYIEALVGLERVSDAKSILQKVRDRGAKISALDRLEQYIALLTLLWEMRVYVKVCNVSILTLIQREALTHLYL